MHIAILSTPSNFHTQKWAEALHNEGEKVSVFSFDSHTFAQPNIQNICVPPTYTYNVQPTYLSYLDGKALRKLLILHKIDLVLAINATPFGVWAAKSRFHPCVIFAVGADILAYPPPHEASPIHTLYSWEKNEFSPDSGLRKLKSRFSKPIFRYQVAQALHFADGVIGDNEVLTRAIHHWFHVPLQKIQLNRGGVEPELFLPNEAILAELRQHFRIPEGATVILSPRGMKPIYQSDIILEAFNILLQENILKNVHFIMLSAGYEVPESLKIKGEMMEAKFSTFFFEKNVLSRQKISQLWRLIDIFLSAPVYDGYSASVAEGRYMGVIPVVNQTPATTEILTHQENGWFVTPFTAQNVANALKEIALSKEKWKTKFAHNNSNWIQEHSLMKHNISSFLNFVSRIIH